MSGVDGRGPEPLTVQRERYVRLIADGVSNSAACRLVGVNRKTGTRWRYGRSIPAGEGRVLFYPPVTAVDRPALSLRYLSEVERTTIGDLHRVGASVRAIAAEIGRSPATVSRELRRNADTLGRYRPATAHRMAVARRSRPRPRRLLLDDELRTVVQQQLTARLSPEQVAQHLREQYPDEPQRQLVTESVYQAIYDPTCGLARERAVLRTGRRRRKRQRRLDARRHGQLARDVMTMIAQRPASVEDRVEPGHWEGDLIMGAGNRSAIGTLVERTTRRLVLVHLGHDKSAGALRTALIDVFATMPAAMRKTLTWDQGTEMAMHLDLARATNIDVFFCEPSKPWQRGSNENMNGLIREYYPKGTDLRVHSRADLDAVALALNNRPCKTLGWATPTKLFEAQVAMSHR